MVDVRPLEEPDREPAHRLRQEVFQERPAAYDEEIDRDYYAPLDRRLGAFDGDRLVGHLAAWDMGQWFGGRRVPMGGVAGVGVLPEQRGRRVASALLERSLALMRERGDAISSLYPANVGLYRSCGWEIAGAWPLRTTTTQAVSRLPRPIGLVSVRRAGPGDLPAIAAAYDGWAAGEPGMLHRPRHYAARITAERDGHQSYVAEVDGKLTGYLWLSRETPSTPTSPMPPRSTNGWRSTATRSSRCGGWRARAGRSAGRSATWIPRTTRWPCWCTTPARDRRFGRSRRWSTG